MTLWVEGKPVGHLEVRSVPFVCSMHRAGLLCAVLAVWGERVAVKFQRDEKQDSQTGRMV